jgi:hypothetical protein
MIECEQILLKDLEMGCWYVGRGRSANIGCWSGAHFVMLCIYKKSWTEMQAIRTGKAITEDLKKGREVIKHESYFYEDEESYYKNNPKENELPVTGLGSFQPFVKVDFGKIIDKIEESGYTRKIRFGNN